MNLRETVQSIRHFLVIVNKVAMTVDVHISVKSHCCRYSGVYPAVG